MNRKETTKQLSKLLENYLNPYNDTRIYTAKEVTFEYGTTHSLRADCLRFVPVNNSVSGIEKGDFYCYEIKSCVDDFNSPNGHNYVGDYNYYVMPKEIFNKVKGQIPLGIGVLTCGDDGKLTAVKKARRLNRKYSVAEMLLMMFRSANRENIKARKEKSDNPLVSLASTFPCKVGDQVFLIPTDENLDEDDTVAAYDVQYIEITKEDVSFCYDAYDGTIFTLSEYNSGAFSCYIPFFSFAEAQTALDEAKKRKFFKTSTLR